MPAPHAAGTFQVHLSVLAQVSGAWTPERQQQATDVIIGHLKNRLDAMLYRDPYRRLMEQRAELRLVHDRLTAKHMQLQAQFEQSVQRDRKSTRLNSSHVKISY